MMYKIGNQITKNIDRQMEFIIEKLGPSSSMITNTQDESIQPKETRQMDYGQVKILSRPQDREKALVVTNMANTSIMALVSMFPIYTVNLIS